MRASGASNTDLSIPGMEVPRMPLDSSYREIQLTQGQFAMVDAEDYAWLMQWKWQATWCKYTNSFYAQRGEKLAVCKWTVVRMHRYILGLEPGNPLVSDHINGKTLNNRRSNLRACTRGQNQFNQKRQKGNTSGFKGVAFSKGAWRARISVNYKDHYLGSFSTPESAYKAYCEAASRLHGEFARIA